MKKSILFIFLIFTLFMSSCDLGINGVFDLTPDEFDNQTSYSVPFPVLTDAQMRELEEIKKGAGVYNNDTSSIYTYDGEDWRSVTGTNRVIVNSLADFPLPDEYGVIHLESKVYQLNNDVLTPYGFNVDDVAVSFTGNKYLIYYGGGTLFTGEPIFINSWNFFFIGYDVGYGGGTLFNVSTNDTSQQKLITMRMTSIVGFEEIGLVEGFLCGWNILAFLDIGHGVRFVNTPVVSITTTTIGEWKNREDSVMIQTEGFIGTFLLNNMALAPNPNETAFNFTHLGFGKLTDVTVSDFYGGKFFTNESYDQTDIYWNIVASNPIPDSTAKGRLRVEDNSLVTTISTADTFYPINANWVDGIEEERFIFNGTDASVTYIGLEPISVSVSGFVSLRLSVGGQYKDVQTRVMLFEVNGTIIPQAKGGVVSVAGAKTLASPVRDLFTIHSGDKIKIYVASLGHTNDIVVTDVNVIMTKG